MSNIYPINTYPHTFLHFVSLFIVVWCLVKFVNIRKHFLVLVICYLFEYHKDRTIQFFVCSLAEKAPNALFHLKTTSTWNFCCCGGLKALWRVGVVDKGSIYIVHGGKVENAAELSGFILYYSLTFTEKSQLYIIKPNLTPFCNSEKLRCCLVISSVCTRCFHCADTSLLYCGHKNIQ